MRGPIVHTQHCSNDFVFYTVNHYCKSKYVAYCRCSQTEKLRKKTNYIIISMAGADLLVGLLSEPIWGLALWVDDEDQKYLTAAKFVVHFSLMSSVSHVLVVTLERTIAVLKPLYYRF